MKHIDVIFETLVNRVAYNLFAYKIYKYQYYSNYAKEIILWNR